MSLSANRAWLLRRGVPDYGPVPIAHGTPASPTPTGRFTVSWRDRDNTSSVYGTPMPYSVFFAPGGIAFHGDDVRTASHGCVHLPMALARVFFNRLRPGEVVQVVPWRDRATPELSTTARVVHSSRLTSLFVRGGR